MGEKRSNRSTDISTASKSNLKGRPNEPSPIIDALGDTRGKSVDEIDDLFATIKTKKARAAREEARLHA